MKLRILQCLLATAALLPSGMRAGEKAPAYWNSNNAISAFRLPPPPAGFTPEYLDLNGDGKPDAIRSITHNDVPVLWLDDDGNLNEAAWNAAVKAAQDQLVRDLMGLIPDLDQEKLEKQVQATEYSYREIKTKIEEEDAKA